MESEYFERWFNKLSDDEQKYVTNKRSTVLLVENPKTEFQSLLTQVVDNEMIVCDIGIMFHFHRRLFTDKMILDVLTTYIESGNVDPRVLDVFFSLQHRYSFDGKRIVFDILEKAIDHATVTGSIESIVRSFLSYHPTCIDPVIQLCFSNLLSDYATKSGNNLCLFKLIQTLFSFPPISTVSVTDYTRNTDMNAIRLLLYIQTYDDSIFLSERMFSTVDKPDYIFGLLNEAMFTFTSGCNNHPYMRVMALQGAFKVISTYYSPHQLYKDLEWLVKVNGLSEDAPYNHILNHHMIALCISYCPFEYRTAFIDSIINKTMYLLCCNGSSRREHRPLENPEQIVDVFFYLHSKYETMFRTYINQRQSVLSTVVEFISVAAKHAEDPIQQSSIFPKDIPHSLHSRINNFLYGYMFRQESDKIIQTLRSVVIHIDLQHLTDLDQTLLEYTTS